MSKFDEFMKRMPKDATPLGEMVGGSFQCQGCYAEVDEAEYFHRERLLIWRCSDGHTSHIEEFML